MRRTRNRHSERGPKEARATPAIGILDWQPRTLCSLDSCVFPWLECENSWIRDTEKKPRSASDTPRNNPVTTRLLSVFGPQGNTKYEHLLISHKTRLFNCENGNVRCGTKSAFSIVNTENYDVHRNFRFSSKFVIKCPQIPPNHTTFTH